MPAQDYNHPEARNLVDVDVKQWQLLPLDRFEVLARAIDVETFKTFFKVTMTSELFVGNRFKIISYGPYKIPNQHFEKLFQVLKEKGCLVEVLKNYTNATAVGEITTDNTRFRNFLTLVSSEELSDLLQHELSQFNDDIGYSWLSSLIHIPDFLGVPTPPYHNCTEATIIKAIEKLTPTVLNDACKKNCLWCAYNYHPNIFKALLEKINAETLEYFYFNFFEPTTKFARKKIAPMIVNQLGEKTLTERTPWPSLLDDEHLKKLLDKAPLLFLKAHYRDAELRNRIQSIRDRKLVTQESIQKFEQQAFFTQEPEIAIRENPKEFLDFLDKHIMPRLKQKNILYLETWLEIIAKALQAIEKNSPMEAQKEHLLALKGALLLFANKGNSDEAWDILKNIRSAENIPSSLCDDIGTRFLSTGNYNVSLGNLFEGRVQQLRSMDFMRVAASNHLESKEDIAVITPAVRLNKFLSTYVGNIEEDSKVDPDNFDRAKEALQNEISELGEGLFADGMRRFDEYMKKRRHESRKYRFVFFAADTDLVTREFIYGALSNNATSWEDKIGTIQAEINSGILRQGWFSNRCEDILRELLDIAININKNMPQERRDPYAKTSDRCTQPTETRPY